MCQVVEYAAYGSDDVRAVRDEGREIVRDAGVGARAPVGETLPGEIEI